MRFRITWRGQSFTDADVLAKDLVAVQSVLGDGWSNFTPWSGPAQVVTLTAAVLARTTGRAFAELVDELLGAPAEELVSALAPVEDDSGVH